MKTWFEANWPAPANIHAGTTFRFNGASQAPYDSFNLGCHVGDAQVAVRENRDCLRQSLGLPAEPRWLSQVHGTDILNDETYSADISADAAITDQDDTVLVVLTADCLPLLLYDETNQRLAAIHIGWRGFAGGMVTEVLQRFNQPDQCLAWLGPSIQQIHYEIDSTVRTACLEQLPEAENAFLASRENHWHMDLPGLVTQQLQQQGLNRIHTAGECSYGNPKHYFSYRRDGITGRMATLIWRSPMK